ncbi:MAG: hypothetical protein M3R04_06955, partial [bacterium]|nr:hypothetical protein [bacterium]
MNRGLAEQSAGPPTDAHIEKLAQAVYALLGAEAPRRFSRRLAEQAHLIEDADDLQQLAVLAFVAGYREGRIRPDEASGAHTAASVSAYLWGAC